MALSLANLAATYDFAIVRRRTAAVPSCCISLSTVQGNGGTAVCDDYSCLRISDQFRELIVFINCFAHAL